MKTLDFDMAVDVPDNFIDIDFLQDLIVLSKKYDCGLVGQFKNYEKNKWKKIIKLFGEILFILRWGV